MDREKVHKTMRDTTKLLLDAGLTGEEYLLVLQTLVAHVLTVNDISVKKVWLMNLNNDVRLRRIAALQVRSAN